MLMKAKKEANPVLVALQKNVRKVLGTGRAYMHAHCYTEEYGGNVGHAVVTFEESYTGRSVTRTTVDVPCVIRPGHTDAFRTVGEGPSAWKDYTDRYAPTRGYESFSIELLASVLLTLPSHANVRIEVALDWNSSPLCVDALLHADAIHLIAEWEERGGQVRRRFVLGSHVSLHNTARFGMSGADR